MPRDNRRMLRFLIPIATAFSFASASAQQPLSLQQAIDLALDYDPRIEEKRAFVRQAEGLFQEADGSDGIRYAVNSYLAVTTGVDGGFYEGGDRSCSPGCEPRDDEYDFEDGYSLWAGLTFTVIKPLMTFGRLENYQDAAQQNITIKQQDVELQRDEVRLQVTRAYYGYLTARDSRFLLEDTLERLGAALELVEEWLDEGTGDVSQSDKFALQSGIGLVQSYLAEAESLETIAMEGLKLLTGLDVDVIELADSRLAPVALPEGDEEFWIEQAFANRVEFKQVEAGLAARRSLVEAQRADSKPIVFAGIAGSMAVAPGRDRLDNPHIYDPFNHVAASPLVGMRWVFESGAQPGRVAQAQAELDALVHKASFARNGIPFQVREQYHTMHARHKSQLAMRDSARSARRWMIAAYTDFEAGLEEADKILTAMQVYVVAYADYLQTVNDFNNHVSKLRSVSGVL